MPFLLIVLGALPLPLGYLMSWMITQNPDLLLPYTLISVGFLLLWGVISFVARSFVKDGKRVVLFLHLFPFLDLLLLGIQELILRAYWWNMVGSLSQFFYLPLLGLGYRLTAWSHTTFSAYCAAFLLMAAVSALGCWLRRSLQSRA